MAVRRRHAYFASLAYFCMIVMCCIAVFRTNQSMPPLDEATSAHKHLVMVCRRIFEPPDRRCPRYMTNKINGAAGFGHKFSEFLFGLWMAKRYGLSYVFEPFTSSGLHSDNYGDVEYLLGMSKTFEILGGINRTSIAAMLKQNKLVAENLRDASLARNCQRVVFNGGFSYCASSPTNNCFTASENEYLFERSKACLRQGVRSFGHAFDRCVFDAIFQSPQRARDAESRHLNVVWHIRLGDFEPHKVGDMFYERVLRALKHMGVGYNMRIVLIGSEAGVPRHYMDFMTKITADVWSEDNDRPQLLSPAYGFSDSMRAMMQADILIGSGSSFPAIAALVSDVPLFFNHVMKHGFNYGAEMTADNVDLEFNGTLLDSARRLKILLHARMHRVDKGPCHLVVRDA
jgi:hypothetical protein